MRDLFDEKRVVRIRSLKLYSWLCYRATPEGALLHALWQVPSAKVDGKQDEWLARINLLAAPIEKTAEDSQRPVKVDPKTKMKLRNELRAIVDKKNENEQGR